MIVDLMHLTLLVLGIGLAAWSLLAYRVRLPKGRFLIFGGISALTLFGCAAVGGEVGLMSQSAWFAIVVAAFGALAIAGRVSGRPSPTWR